MTKSGTSEFHGDLREFLHNTAFNARQFGAPNKPKDHLLVVNLSGRGDKDLDSVAKHLGAKHLGGKL